MFVLQTVEDDVCVQPSNLNKPPLLAVSEVIEQRYLDRVVPDLGLVVTLYDVTSIEGGFIYPNDGAAWFSVKFRLVVFRPFVGEVVTGTLKSCDAEGLRISLGFFEDVLVPEYALQDPSVYDENEKLWIWRYDGNDMYMDIGELVRFRVHAVRYNPLPTPLQLQSATGDEKLLGTAARPFAPMEVVAEINGDGLGLTSWWAEAQADADGAGGDDNHPQ